MRTIIITHPTPKDIRSFFTFKDDDYIIAVDQAVMACYKQRLKIDLAVGDFDSLQNKGVLEQLNVVILNQIKDVTDTYQALVEANNLEPSDLILIGGFGGNRSEHFLANLMYFHEFPQLIMMNETTTIQMLADETKTIITDRYISLFGYPEGTVTLSGFQYDLEEYPLKLFNPIGISNELKKEEGHIHVKGHVLLILSEKETKK
ncbi:MAG: thiamine diphosphokinase [Acholeplasmataceae bacterium]